MIRRGPSLPGRQGSLAARSGVGRLVSARQLLRGHDHLAARMPRHQIAHRSGRLGERVCAVDEGCDAPVLHQRGELEQAGASHLPDELLDVPPPKNQPRRMAGMVMLALLRRWGLDIERDLTLVDFGLNDRSFDTLRAGEIDAALLPPEKAFLIESEGFRVVADSRALDCHWVPLATTRRFLSANRELVIKIAAGYAESIRFFKSEPQATQREIGNWLPALGKNPQVVKKCYELFAELFEPTLTPSLDSIDSILREVALQDPRAREVQAAALVERLI